MKNKILIIMFLVFIVSVSFVSAEIHTNYVTNVNVVNGLEEGSINSTKVYNSNFYRVNEVISDIGLEFYINITGVQGNISELITNQRYKGGASHFVIFSIYNYSSSSWDLLKEYGNVVNFESNSYTLNDDYLKDGIVMLKYFHPDTGIDTHYFDIDYLVLISSGVVLEEDSSYNIFSIDFDNKINTIFFIFLSLVALFMLLFVDTLFPSIIFILQGMILIASLSPLIGVFIMITGFLFIFIDKPLLIRN